jgi:hypothetical protein
MYNSARSAYCADVAVPKNLPPIMTLPALAPDMFKLPVPGLYLKPGSSAYAI